MITVQEMITKKEMKQFVKFPFSIYKDNPYWVPPIIKDELQTLDKEKNPAFENAEARFFVALKDGKIVGRLAAIINWYEVNEQQIKKMRFGWYDVVDDINVSKILIEKVKEIGYQNQLEYIEGPVGFSNLDKVGVLIEGFDHIGTMITWYSQPHYKDHLEQLGFVKEKEYLENKFQIKNVDPVYYDRIAKIISRRFNLKALNFTKTKDIMPYVDEMFELFGKTYSKLSSYVPISDTQIKYFKERYIGFINPEFIKFVIDENGKLVAFAIIMPSFSKALQKANGSLFPFGMFNLLKARKNPKVVTSYLIGVDEQYQNKGVTAIIFNEYKKTCTEKGVETMVRTPELEDNTAIHQIWKNFDPVTHKRRRTYRLDL
ncbi:GTP cyclohydrolase [Pseudotenacibaculum sp. MALMAid0570]|uniref:GTP cyclohydrolase n=1 Tax=Pseudotenacibaculum sp. MALMAid0570 TaxID=3143938 RepID=UPI0032DF0633